MPRCVRLHDPLVLTPSVLAYRNLHIWTEMTCLLQLLKYESSMLLSQVLAHPWTPELECSLGWQQIVECICYTGPGVFNFYLSVFKEFMTWK